MVIKINQNIMAANAARNLKQSATTSGTSMSRLSSDLRISQRDSEGLALREIMHADISSLNQGMRNADEAIGLLDEADGALSVIGENVTRMHELAEQVATGTFTDAQSVMVDEQFQAYKAEIDRIANSASHNGIHMLNVAPETQQASLIGNSGGLKVHFGMGDAMGKDYYVIAFHDVTAKGLGLANLNAATQEQAQEAVNCLSDSVIMADKARADLSAVRTRLEHTKGNLQLYVENLQAAESQIRNVDVAKEMAQLARNQILNAAQVTLLRQANSVPQTVLSLIG